MLEQFEKAKKAGTPLLAVRTMDNAATQYSIAARFEDKSLLAWNCVQGLVAVNGPGEMALTRVLDGADTPTDPVEALSMLGSGRLPKDTIVFFHNLQLFMDPSNQRTALILQAWWNLRDLFKENKQVMCQLGPWIALPPEIGQDVVILDEPLPNDEQLTNIVTDVYASGGLKSPEKKVLDKAVDALRGLAAFPAEQVSAMSLTKAGLDLSGLWDRKIMMVEQTRGLTIWRGGESFDNVKGYDNVETYLKKIFDGRQPPKGVMFIDEIEKHLAGATGGDLSGVKQGMLGAMLSWMQDRKVEGIILIGVSGSGKSAVAKAAANYAGVLSISFDLDGMQEGIVGSSGQNMRNALKVVDAVTSNQVLVLATCNSIQALPPELRRRFTLGTFFFDLPSKFARQKIWELYFKQLDLKKGQTIPDDEGWTGAEIEKCCRIAWRLNCTVKDAASFIVPVAKSDPNGLDFLRKMAHDTFISASDGGPYQYTKAASKAPPQRAISLN